MVPTFLILVGGYSTYIYTLLFNPSKSSLTSLARSNSSLSPSWIAQSPVDPTIIYATQEVEADPGMLYSYTLDRTSGNLTVKSSVNTLTTDAHGGNVYIASLDGGNALMTTNYFSGSVFYVPLESDHLNFSNTSQQVVTFIGKGPDPQQDMSHPHEAIPYNDEILVPDLGSDKVRRLARTNGNWSEIGSIDFTPGSGPRHIVVRNNTLYTLHEICNCLTQNELVPVTSDVASKIVANFTIIPQDTYNTTGMRAGELLYAPSPEGKHASPLLYASNRDDQTPSGDALAIFETTPALKLVAEFRTGLKHLRGVNFVGSKQQYIVIGGMYGGGIKVFERVSAAEGYLKEVAAFPEGEIFQPASFVWA